MSTPKTSPLTEAQIVSFYKSKAVAIFTEEGKGFVGGVSILEHDIDEHGTVLELRVSFLWLAEVEKNFLTPIKGGVVSRGEVRKFLFPQKIEKPGEKKDVLTCCAGKQYDKKIKLTRDVLHILAINQVGEECGIINLE